MLAISILAALAYIVSIAHNADKHELLHVNTPIAAILTISTWSVLPIAIIVMTITVLINLVGIILNEKK